MSGKADMNPCATSAMASRPTAGSFSFTLSEPFGAKNAATLAASWLPQAAVYRPARSRRLSESIGIRLRGQSAQVLERAAEQVLAQVEQAGPERRAVERR